MREGEKTMGISKGARAHFGAALPQEAEYQRMLELSAEGLLEGLDRAWVVKLLLARIRRDEAYLRYRRGHRLRTRYDEETEGDLRALALAVCWLEEAPAR